MPLLEGQVRPQQPPALVVLVQRGDRHRGQQHELHEVRLETDQEVDVVLDVLRRVVLHAQDARGEDRDAAVPQVLDQLAGVDTVVLGEVALAAAAFDADPHQIHPEAHQVVDTEGGDRLGRREDVEAEEALVALHLRRAAPAPGHGP